jgi:hypothetical protein
MSYYAKVNNGIVEKVIVANSTFFDNYTDDSPGEWVETFITGGVRKNYAGVGHSYDSIRDAFITQNPFSSWELNDTTCQWKPPVAFPAGDKAYEWDESTENWLELLEEI